MNNFEELLIRTREQLLDAITSLDHDQFNQIIEINKWSIAQVCHHLFITETLFTKAIVFGLGQKNIKETERKPIQLVSDRTKKFIAPKISEPSLEPFQVQQIIQLLSDSRNNLMDVLSKIEDKSILKAISVRHPVFEDLPLDQWIELLYFHEQRHIEQIKEIKVLS